MSRYISLLCNVHAVTKLVPSCGTRLLRVMPPSGHAKQSSRPSKKLKPRQQLRKKGVGEKKKKPKRRQGRSELRKLLNVLKQRPQPTRNDGTRRGLRERRRERSKNKRGSWLRRGKRIRNYNRACKSSLVSLEAKVTLH